MSFVVQVLLTALAAMIKVFFVCLVGGLISHFPRENPLLPANSLRTLARLSNFLFLPCLMFSTMGATVSIGMLQKFLPLLIGSYVIILGSYGLGLVYGLVLRPEPRLWKKLELATAFPNTVSMPLLLMGTFCEQSIVHSEFEDGQEECRLVSTSMLFVYSIGWHTLFWAWGYHRLADMGDFTSPAPSPLHHHHHLATRGQGQQGEAPPASPVGVVVEEQGGGARESKRLSFKRLRRGLSLKHWHSAGVLTRGKEGGWYGGGGAGLQQPWWMQSLVKLAMQPCLVAVFAGIVLGLITPLQEMVFKRPSVLRPLGAAATALGEPAPTLSILIMAGSLAQINLRKLMVRGEPPRSEGAQKGKRTSIALEDDYGDGKGKEEGSTAGAGGMARAREEESGAENKSTACLNRVKHEGEGASRPAEHKEGEEDLGYSKSVHVGWRHLVGFMICRLLLVPVVGITIIQVLKPMVPLLEGDNLLQLVLVMQTGVPSAQTIIVCLSQFGQQELASNMSYLYLIQYSLSVLTMTLVLSVGMLYIYN